MAGIEFADVARLLTAEEFARHELAMKRGRAQCPFHGGDHFNLQFFKDGKCYCHVCHKGGDVVTLAAAVWRVSQMDAARLLNHEYRLGLDAETPTDEQRQARQREREQRELDRQREAKEWATAADDLRDAEAAVATFTVADADSPATWAAVARLGRAQDRWHGLRAGL